MEYLIRIRKNLEKWPRDEQPKIRTILPRDDLQREIQEDRKKLEKETGGQFSNEIDYEVGYLAEDMIRFVSI